MEPPNLPIVGARPNQDEFLAALGGRSVVLVGMMGAGKTSVGRRLASRLGLRFAEADREIELSAQMSIPEIFATYGEPAFRSGEIRVIARLLQEGQRVLATGGGAYMSAETREAARVSAVTVWLRADLDVLMRRLKRRSDRPLLQGVDPEVRVTQLLAEREPLYRLADLAVHSRDLPHEAVVEDVVQALWEHLIGGARERPGSPMLYAPASPDQGEPGQDS